MPTIASNDRFKQETLDAYHEGSYPVGFFEPSVASMRVKVILRHLCETDDQFLLEIYQHMDESWIKARRLDILYRYAHLSGSSLIDTTIVWIHSLYPELPDFDHKTHAVWIHQQIMDGRRKTYPYRFFSGSLGEIRANAILDNLQSQGIQPRGTAVTKFKLRSVLQAISI